VRWSPALDRLSSPNSFAVSMANVVLVPVSQLTLSRHLQGAIGIQPKGRHRHSIAPGPATAGVADAITWPDAAPLGLDELARC